MSRQDGQSPVHLLVTGASGKVGGKLLPRLLTAFPHAEITAMTHSRDVSVDDSRVRVMRGDISDRVFVNQCMEGVTHVVHMATCKEIPELVMDVTVKGMFWLLEAFREKRGEYFILLGGDAAIGHFIYPVDGPVADDTPHRAYAGCYALSKVLEEVLLAQSHIQYGTHGCCLRAPWIMADDDLRYALTFGPDVFGAPRWFEEVGTILAARYAEEQVFPLALAADGRPLQRGIVSVDDVVDAIIAALQVQPVGCETFNIAMDEPFDYGVAAAHVETEFGHESVEIATPFHSVRLDNGKARRILGWRPRYDTKTLIDAAWAHVPGRQDARKIIYPG